MNWAMKRVVACSSPFHDQLTYSTSRAVPHRRRTPRPWSCLSSSSSACCSGTPTGWSMPWC